MKNIMLALALAYAPITSAISKNALTKLLKKHGISKKDVAFCVVDLESGKEAASHNSDKPMLLASVTKALSLYYALSVLGAEHTFKTKLWIKGEVKDGSLKGDVVLEGGGDPYLVPAHLMSMALALKEKGINKVEGNFFYNQDALPFVERISPKVLDDQPYNPSIGALNTDFNRFSAFKDSQTLPSLDHLKIVKAKSGLPRALSFKSSPNEEEEIWSFGKKTRRRFVEELPVRRPGLFSSNYFRYIGSLAGVDLPEPSEGKISEGSVMVYAHESLPLIRLAALAMEYSNNMFAELPALTASKKLEGKKLSLEESSKRMKKWFIKKFPDIDFNSATFNNASGLSVVNAMSAKSLAQTLFSIHKESFGQRRYWSLLSINGKSGWLANRLDRPDLAFRVWAKTGSLDFVSNLAGYYIDKNGRRKAFSLLLTDKSKRKALNSPLSAKAYTVRKLARRWNNKASRFADELLTAWINAK